jgi:hypothetical protein
VGDRQVVARAVVALQISSIMKGAPVSAICAPIQNLVQRFKQNCAYVHKDVFGFLSYGIQLQVLLLDIFYTLE